VAYPLRPVGHIFISHLNVDHELAMRAVDAIERSGRTCWIAPRDIAPGADYFDTLETAARTAALIVYLHSATAMTSRYCKAELDIATDADLPIIPVRIDDTSITGGLRIVLSGRQWLDGQGDVDTWLPHLDRALATEAPTGEAVTMPVTAAADLTRPADSTVEVPGQVEWTADMLATLHANLRYPLVRMLLDACAAAPGSCIPKAAIDEHSERGPLQLRNELGAFSKLTKKLFGAISWPVEWRKVDGLFEYRMDEVLGPIWRSLGAASPSSD